MRSCLLRFPLVHVDRGRLACFTTGSGSCSVWVNFTVATPSVQTRDLLQCRGSMEKAIMPCVVACQLNLVEEGLAQRCHIGKTPVLAVMAVPMATSSDTAMLCFSSCGRRLSENCRTLLGFCGARCCTQTMRHLSQADSALRLANTLDLSQPCGHWVRTQ